MTEHDTSRQFYEEALIAAKIGCYELHPTVNQYYGITGAPWYQALTEFGIIILGHRKRVYVIDWTHAWGLDREMMLEKFKDEFVPGTSTHVTHGGMFCHAWTPEKFQEYLNHIPNCLNVLNAEKELQKMKDALLGRTAILAEEINTAMKSLKLIDTNEWHIRKPSV